MALNQLPSIDHLPLHQIPEWNYTSGLWQAVSFYDLFLVDNPLQFTMLPTEERMKVLQNMARSKEVLITEAKENWVLNMVVRKFFEPRPKTEPLPCSLLDLPEAFQDAVLTKIYYRSFPQVLRTCRCVRNRVYKRQNLFRIQIPNLNIRFHRAKVSVSKTPQYSNYSYFNDSYTFFVFKKLIVIPEEKSPYGSGILKVENAKKVKEALRVKTYTGTTVVDHSLQYKFSHDDQIRELNPTWLNMTYLEEEDVELIESLKALRKITIFPMPASESLHKLFQQVETVKVTLEAEREDLLNPIFEYIRAYFFLVFNLIIFQKRCQSYSLDKIHHATVFLNGWTASLSRFLQDFKVSFVSCSGYDVPGENESRIRFFCYLFPLPDERKHCLIMQTDYKGLERKAFGYPRKTSFAVCFDIKTVGDAVAFMSKRLLHSFVIDFSFLDFESQDFKQFFGVITNYLFGDE